jgi:hypothetical protein
VVVWANALMLFINTGRGFCKHCGAYHIRLLGGGSLITWYPTPRLRDPTHPLQHRLLQCCGYSSLTNVPVVSTGAIQASGSSSSSDTSAGGSVAGVSLESAISSRGSSGSGSSSGSSSSTVTGDAAGAMTERQEVLLFCRKRDEAYVFCGRLQLEGVDWGTAEGGGEYVFRLLVCCPLAVAPGTLAAVHAGQLLHGCSFASEGRGYQL